MKDEFATLTESCNAASQGLDKMSSMEIAALMNNEDKFAVEAVRQALPSIAAVINDAFERLRGKGRLFYVGAGTSGRLGALDASECPPTFGTEPEKVQCVMAGGEKAFFRAAEHAEDNREAGAQELEKRNLCADDFVIGISASGRTPFVIGALDYAAKLGAGTAAVFCNPGAPMAGITPHPILLETGPEVLAGSTRLKAGTATKMALNMISTGIMVKLGHCLGNRMIDVKASCEKLRVRRVRIVAEETGISFEEAEKMLESCGGDLREAIKKASSR
ncbi:MAG: N-acetylmuramic acid 6-phosphate etherase [bacterium]|nr:N-acetylmuramic acid 6-phosphate etherase [bacterium]